MQTPAWRKATRSDDHGNCIELAALPNAIAVRDSKAPEAGHLSLAPVDFVGLLARLRQGGSAV